MIKTYVISQNSLLTDLSSFLMGSFLQGRANWGQRSMLMEAGPWLCFLQLCGDGWLDFFLGFLWTVVDGCSQGCVFSKPNLFNNSLCLQRGLVSFLGKIILWAKTTGRFVSGKLTAQSLKEVHSNCFQFIVVFLPGQTVETYVCFIPPHFVMIKK